MTTCLDALSGDISFDCNDKPIRGLDGRRAVIINVEDIDRTQLTQTGATVSALELYEGKAGFKVEWYKELGSTEVEYAPSDEDIDGFTHSFLARFATTTANNAERARELKNGRFIVVVETSYKGDNNQEAFKIYGLHTGMELAELTGNSQENSGSLLFTLSTREGTFEPFPYNVFFDTSYETTKNTVDALFASASP